MLPAPDLRLAFLVSVVPSLFFMDVVLSPWARGLLMVVAVMPRSSVTLALPAGRFFLALSYEVSRALLLCSVLFCSRVVLPSALE